MIPSFVKQKIANTLSYWLQVVFCVLFAASPHCDLCSEPPRLKPWVSLNKLLQKTYFCSENIEISEKVKKSL